MHACSQQKSTFLKCPAICSFIEAMFPMNQLACMNDLTQICQQGHKSILLTPFLTVKLIATQDFPNMAKHNKTQPDIAISWTEG
jgi:hypothetical protein